MDFVLNIIIPQINFILVCIIAAGYLLNSINPFITNFYNKLIRFNLMTCFGLILSCCLPNSAMCIFIIPRLTGDTRWLQKNWLNLETINVFKQDFDSVESTLSIRFSIIWLSMLKPLLVCIKRSAFNPQNVYFVLQGRRYSSEYAIVASLWIKFIYYDNSPFLYSSLLRYLVPIIVEVRINNANYEFDLINKLKTYDVVFVYKDLKKLYI